MALSNFLNVPVRMADLLSRAGLEPVGTSEAPDGKAASPAGAMGAAPSRSPVLLPDCPPLAASRRYVPPAPGRGPLPLQVITPADPVSANLSSPSSNYTVNGNECWSTVWYFSTRPIRFALRTYVGRDVTLSLVMRTCFPIASAFTVVANGQTVHTYNPSEDTWFTQHVTLPAGCLQEGINHVELRTPAAAYTRLGIPLGIWVQSASVGWHPGWERGQWPDEPLA